MKKLKYIFLMINLLHFYSFAEEIADVVILDNPPKEVSTIKTRMLKDKAEMNITVQKITSTEIPMRLSLEQDKIFFNIEDLESSDIFYITNNMEFFKEKTRYYEKKDEVYEAESIDILHGIVKFKNNEMKGELYLIRLNRNNKRIKKIYKIKNQDRDKLIVERGELIFTFNENYRPFDIINLNLLKGREEEKGTVEIKSGKMLKLDSNLITEVIITDEQDKKVGNIKLINGNGILDLGKNKEGIILKNGSSVLNLGIGFENGEVLLQEKGSTNSNKSYTMKLKLKNIDGSIGEYKIIINPVNYGLKILNQSLNFNFIKDLKNDEKIEKQYSLEQETVIAKDYLQIESKELEIRVKFKNNGKVQLRRGDKVFNVNLEGRVLDKKNENIKRVEVIGKVERKEIINLPEGDYIGEVELEIEIDS